jgi:hypothetical protein
LRVEFGDPVRSLVVERYDDQISFKRMECGKTSPLRASRDSRMSSSRASLSRDGVVHSLSGAAYFGVLPSSIAAAAYCLYSRYRSFLGAAFPSWELGGDDIDRVSQRRTEFRVRVRPSSGRVRFTDEDVPSTTSLAFLRPRLIMYHFTLITIRMPSQPSASSSEVALGRHSC